MSGDREPPVQYPIITKLKYGEGMANPATAMDVGGSPFHHLNPDPARPLGYVNHLDILAAACLMRATGGTAIMKHSAPCGAATAFTDPAEEYAAASAVDEVARFGGIIGTPHVTANQAYEIVGRTGKKKQDGLVAFVIDDEALRIIKDAELPPQVFTVENRTLLPPTDTQYGLFGPVTQERTCYPVPNELEVTRGVRPDDNSIDDLIFGMKVIDWKPSNAVGFVHRTENGIIAVGIGGGTSDRISAAYQGMEKAVKYFVAQYVRTPQDKIPEVIAIDLSMVSDGFFPDTAALKVCSQHEIQTVISRVVGAPYQTERDEFLTVSTRKFLESEGLSLEEKSAEIGARLRITVPRVLAPLGSKKDSAVMDYAAELGMTFVAPKRNGQNMRFFKHGPFSSYQC